MGDFAAGSCVLLLLGYLDSNQEQLKFVSVGSPTRRHIRWACGRLLKLDLFHGARTRSRRKGWPARPNSPR